MIKQVGASLLLLITLAGCDFSKPAGVSDEDFISAYFGDAEAQYEVGLNHEQWVFKNNKSDYRKAFYWYSMAANQGLPDAQKALSRFYRWGMGVPRSEYHAYVWSLIAIASDPSSSTYMNMRNQLSLSPAEIVLAEREAVAIYLKIEGMDEIK